MNSLRQLIDQGVAPMRTSYWGKGKPYQHCCTISNLVNMYNNIYGTITNTHMDIGPWDFSTAILTGSLISNQNEWTKFICSKTYLGVTFELPFIEWIESLGYEMRLQVVNGQPACLIKQIEIHEMNPKI